MPRVKANQVSYTTEQKIAAVKYAVEFSLAKAATHFDINVSQIIQWKRSTTLMQSIRDLDRKIIKRNRKNKWPEMEEYLSSWIIKQRQDGQEVMASLVLKEAQKQAPYMNLEDFRGSITWVRKLMKRKQLDNNKTNPTNENLTNTG